MNDANQVAKNLNLVKSASRYEFYSQDELSNDDLIDAIQEESNCVFNSEECELFVFSDSSCINRQGDEYFLNDDVDLLAHEFLTEVGYL